MFVAHYDRTMMSAKRVVPDAGIDLKRKAKPSLGIQQMELFNTEQRARKQARQIIDEAHNEAAKIIAAAEVKAEIMAAEAITRVGKILGMAGMEPGECKQPVIDIIRVVAVKHGVGVVDIKSQTRTRHIVDARQEAMALVYKLRPDLSTPAIGRIFNRDHTTILHAVRKLGVFRGVPPSPGRSALDKRRMGL